jgi:hypothetical protein
MPDIPRDVAEHSLDIRAGARPVKQPLRRFDEEKRRAIGEEIHKLMVAGFIKEVFHPEWLANPVLVRKKGGKWRMCVDYTGLNRACPKVPYPLPHIDQIVDSTAGCETLSFLDAYSGYHQIRMKESDQLATSFITPFGMYCYVTMPFGLRNAGATLKGKCALGPFLSILVIECKHKCLNVKICPWMNKVQITSKGMFLSLSTLVLCTNILSKC